MTDKLPALAASDFEALLAPFGQITKLAIAVSGGPDSMALLSLAAASKNVPIIAFTVDHGLRAEAKAEAEMVANWCVGQGISHQTLLWEHNGVEGNLQANAREARYQLLCDAAKKAGASHLAVAHTLEDQAETLLLRLMRGSGVDGLSAMSALVEKHEMAIIRPLLGVQKARLLEHLAEADVPFAQDPSNQDQAFDRVRARALMAELPLDAGRLVRTASLMASEREALDWAARQAWAGAVTLSDFGYATLALEELPQALAMRLLRRALRLFSAQTYPPDYDALQRLYLGEQHTLAGVQFRDGVMVVEHGFSRQNLPSGQWVSPDPRFDVCAMEAGWQSVPRGDLAKSDFSKDQLALLQDIPAMARPHVPIYVSPAGRPHISPPDGVNVRWWNGA